MESANPGGTGKDRAARSMILDAEGRGDLPPPLRNANYGDERMLRCEDGDGNDSDQTPRLSNRNDNHPSSSSSSSSSSSFSNIPPNVHEAILTALRNTRTHGIIIEGTSGSTGISLASLSCARGHAVVVVLPDDQSTQKADFLKRLGCGVAVVRNCSISNPGHYVNVARRVWEWLQVERRYDAYYWENVVGGRNGALNGLGIVGNGDSHDSTPPRLIRAAFMNQFENLANVRSHYLATGPEIHSQLDGAVDAFVMSAGTGGTLVGVGGYLKEMWWRDRHERGRTTAKSPPRIVLVDPPGSSLLNKVKHGVAYASQQSEMRLRRHRYDTLAEGIGLDRVTANFAPGCEDLAWGRGRAFGDRVAAEPADDDDADSTCARPQSPPDSLSKLIDDAVRVTDQQAVDMAHYLLRHEGLFVGSSTAMNVAGALVAASRMPPGSNVVTVACDGGQRHVGRFWNREFVVEERGLVWPGDDDDGVDGGEGGKQKFLERLGIVL